MSEINSNYKKILPLVQLFGSIFSKTNLLLNLPLMSGISLIKYANCEYS